MYLTGDVEKGGLFMVSLEWMIHIVGGNTIYFFYIVIIKHSANGIWPLHKWSIRHCCVMRLWEYIAQKEPRLGGEHTLIIESIFSSDHYHRLVAGLALDC